MDVMERFFCGFFRKRTILASQGQSIRGEACVAPERRVTIELSMATEEEQYDYTGEAIKAAKKAEEKAKAEAVAKGGPKENPNLERVLLTTLEALGGKGKARRAEFVQGLRKDQNLLFARAMSKDARERFQARFGLFDLRYPEQTPVAAKADLELVWNLSESRGIAPNKIIDTPAKLEHSAVAMELVTREATLKLHEKLGNDPRMWYQELARAYQSIDFKNITPEQAVELRGVFEKSFDYMRELAKPIEGFDFPADNKKLWRGLGDYYFSMMIPEDATPPAGVDETAWKRERKEFNNYITELQTKLSFPNAQEQEKDILKKTEGPVHRSLESDHWKFFKNEALQLQRRLAVEIEGLNQKGRYGQKDQGSAEAQAKLWESIEYKERGNLAPFSLNIEAGKLAFTGDEFVEVQRRLNELDSLFRLKPGEELGWEQAEPTKLSSAFTILDEIERSHRRKMNPEQIQLIEMYQNQIRAQMESLRHLEQPVNRLYLGEDEKLGLDLDPVGTSERMFLEAMRAFVKDPDGPLAKFYLDRMELMQYYLFSRQHTAKEVEIFIIKDPGKFLEAIEARGGAVDVHRLTPEEIAKGRKAVSESMGKEKTSFERSFTNRLHEVLYIQQWQHTDEYSNDYFQRFLNTRMLEDDFWGMDSQFGGLLKRFRMTLAHKYEQKMFDAQGNRVAHVDTLWDEAVRETADELQHRSDYEETWKRYLAGDFFTEVPGSGEQSSLARKADATAKGVEEQMLYKDACEMLTQFAAFRMIMSDEKYLMDFRFLPVRWGELREQIPTQFLEKQKVVKLFAPFEAWQITWGGITQGYAAEERMMLRRRTEILRKAFPEIDKWGEEWAEDWWKNRLQRMGDNSISEEQKKLWWGDLRGLFIFSVDDFDQVPPFKSSAESVEWLKDNLTLKKLKNEAKFYAGMRVSDMIDGEFPYLAVFESGARRKAAFGALKDLLGFNDPKIIPKEKDKITFVAKQNFLAFTELEAGQNYFGKKQTEDTAKARMTFLEGQSFVAHYSPHGRLMALREGESKSLRAQLQRGRFGGEAGFGKFYADLAKYHEDIFAELALGEQIDYDLGLVTQQQKNAALRAFENGEGPEHAREKMDKYFKDMKEIVDYLKPAPLNELGKVPEQFKYAGDAAIAELTDIRYGPLLRRLRRDDYPYEYVQHPERAIPILMKQEYHKLYDPRLDPYDKGGRYVDPSKHVDIIKAKFEELKKDAHLTTLYLTPASDRFEPTSARDEQSGLWRRNKRDLGGRAGAWALTGDAWSIDERVSGEARRKRFKTAVGISGQTSAKLIDLLDNGQRLAIQRVYSRYGPFFEGMPDSSDIKKVYPNRKSKSSDELLHEFEVGQEASGGVSRLTAPDALGVEYGVKQVLGITYWNKILGGTSKREEWVESMSHGPLRRFFTKKRLENFVEWLDHRAPLGVWATKGLVGGGIAALFTVLYVFQAARSGGKEEKER